MCRILPRRKASFLSPSSRLNKPISGCLPTPLRPTGTVYQGALAAIADEAVSVAAELRVGEAKVEAGELAPVEEAGCERRIVQAQSAALDAHHAERQASINFFY